jgi:hypothetical protein
MSDNSKNNHLPNKTFRVNAILQEYISIHDQIFKPSLRKSIRIPGFFKAIDFAQLSDDLEILANELEEIAILNDFEDHPTVLRKYTTALLSAIQALRVLCARLYSKTSGIDYSTEDYKADVNSYQKLVDEYRAIGTDLDLQLSKMNMIGTMAKRPNSWILINHFIHIFVGLLFPGTFIWTTNGIWSAVLLSVVTQGIDQFRIYLNYQNEFKLIDRIRGIKEGRSIGFEIGTLFQHGQMFIFKIIWYGLVTMVSAGLRR